ncbi:Cytochrome c oxidase subunit 4 [Hanseniaspora osmophila]|uniref:Cytochrome c oxidase subunit 4, mitochondrial n=1 Tax=Hanseniaspora osmophila TaxID=56408 RepID=A0A1E5RAA1_9ASCO|nr:Cytochrome c oxidase subunit 4, mitochondrial [Hanseniaspora osmophila]
MLSIRSHIARSTRQFSVLRTVLNEHHQQQPVKFHTAKTLSEVDGPQSLIGEGAAPGTVATDVEQATGLARLELLGKLEGIEVFDTKPLDSSRIGTMANPIMVDSYDDYRYVGCTGSPAGSHPTMWLKPNVNQISRCWDCGSVYKLNRLGSKTDNHH